jgi:hypothetical protein
MVVLAAALVLGSAAGCSKKSPTQPTNDTAGAQAKVEAANLALGRILADLMDSDPQRPSDADFSGPYRLYQDALVLDPTNGDAHFGVAVTGLLVLSADPEVNAAFDEWSAYLKDNVPFQVPATPLRPLGVPITFTGDRNALRLPFQVVPLSLLAEARAWRTAVDPQIGRIQDIFEYRVLPRLNEALAHLDIVASDAGYTFIVTPAMQGDPNASPVEIDRTDILALRAAGSLLAAIVRVAVSYQLGFDAYDCEHLSQGLTPGTGDWLTLRPNGATNMRAANDALLAAIEKLDQAITSLLGETDNQDDDVIKVGPDAASRDELEQFQATLPDVRAGLIEGLEVTGDWDSDPSTPEISLTLRPGLLLTDPVADWKALLPTYTPSTTNRPFDRQYVYEYYIGNVPIQAPAPGYYYGGYSLSVRQGQVSEYPYGDTFVADSLASRIQSRYEQEKAQPNWAGDFNGSASFYGNLSGDPEVIALPFNISYTNSRVTVCVPVITWTANRFEDWVWPDPTLHGFLPDMQNTSQLLDSLGYDRDAWTKEFVIDWTGSLAGVGVPSAPPVARAMALRRRARPR